MSSKDNKNCKKSANKKYIESFTNNDDNTSREYIIKHKSKYYIQKEESDSESDIKKCKHYKKCKHDTESGSDSESTSEYKSKHCKNKESDTELFEYFIKNKYYKKICNYYEIDLNYKKNECNKDELNKNSIRLFKKMLNKYSNGRIIIFFQEEK